MPRDFPLLNAVREIRNRGARSDTAFVKKAEKEPIHTTDPGPVNESVEETPPDTKASDVSGEYSLEMVPSPEPEHPRALPVAMGSEGRDSPELDDEGFLERQRSESGNLHRTTCPVCLREFDACLPTLHGEPLCEECLSLLR